MSPLVAAPNRGYPDWQRIDNYDTGILWSLNLIGVTTTQQSPIIDVSRHACIAGQIAVSGDNCAVQMQWFADSGATVVVGERDFQLSGFLFPTFQPTIRNMGPFLRIAITPIASVATSITVNLFATNRPSPLEVVPRRSMCTDIQNQALAANQVIVINPTDYLAGPVYVYAIASQAYAVQFQQLNPGGGWDFIYSAAFAASVTANFPFTVPLGAWRGAITNQSGVAAVYYFNVQSAVAGSN